MAEIIVQEHDSQQNLRSYSLTGKALTDGMSAPALA